MMKNFTTTLFCVVFSLVVYAQSTGNSGGSQLIDLMSARPYSICPITDEEAVINMDYGGDQYTIPYDFYASFNCPVKHTLDSVFYVDSDTTILDVACSSPCYVIIYGMDLGQESGFHFIPVSTYSNGKYRINTHLGDLCYGLNRIIVTKDYQVLQKVVYSQSSNPMPDTPITPGPSGTNGTNSIVIPDSPYSCTVTITNTWDNTITTFSGNIANNMYFLYGNVAVPSYSFATYYNAQLPHEPYSIFTTHSTTDVDMFLINSDNEIIGHNNNYSTQSSHDWGTEARIDLSGNDSLKAIVLVPHRFYIEYYDDYWGYDEFPWTADTTPDGKTDLYLGCKFFYMNQMNYHFPNLRSNDALVSDRYTSPTYGYNYNCHAWTAYPTNYYLRQGYLGNNYSTASIAYYLCHYHGFSEVGATEENSEVDIWEHLGYATHTSVKSYGGGAGGYSYGYGWESKLGALQRIMHPRYALTNDDVSNTNAYGHVVKHLIKDPNYVESNYIFENIFLSDDEIDIIHDMEKNVPANKQETFNRYYSKICQTVINNCISNIGILAQYDENYKHLVGICAKDKDMLALIIGKLAANDWLSAIILLDIVKTGYKEVADAVTEYGKQNNTTESGCEIVRTDFAEATLCVKELLAKLEGRSIFPYLLNKSYSDDEQVLKVDLSGRDIYVTVNLKNDAKVSLFHSDSRGLYTSFILREKKLESGNHQYRVRQDVDGIKVLTLLVDGRVYSQKVYAK